MLKSQSTISKIVSALQIICRTLNEKSLHDDLLHAGITQLVTVLVTDIPGATSFLSNNMT